MTATEVIRACTISGNVVKLPNLQLDRKTYLEVAKSINLIGGKWKGGKIGGFFFEADPTALLGKVAEGDKVNLKKEYQFFETPEELAIRLVEYCNLQPNDSVLEPSAGRGALMRQINSKGIVPDCYELMDLNRLALSNSDLKYNLMGEDFLLHTGKKYDKIIANPPFTKNQDIAHFRKMYDCLNSGGTIACVLSTSWIHGSFKIQEDFKNWLNEKTHFVVKNAKGAFKESGTMVETCVIVLVK